MTIELNENEQVVLTRLYQIYHPGMYRNLYAQHGTDYPCDKYCEEFMRSTIENLVMKMKAQKHLRYKDG